MTAHESAVYIEGPRIKLKIADETEFAVATMEERHVTAVYCSRCTPDDRPGKYPGCDLCGVWDRYRGSPQGWGSGLMVDGPWRVLSRDDALVAAASLARRTAGLASQIIIQDDTYGSPGGAPEPGNAPRQVSPHVAWARALPAMYAGFPRFPAAPHGVLTIPQQAAVRDALVDLQAKRGWAGGVRALRELDALSRLMGVPILGEVLPAA